MDGRHYTLYEATQQQRKFERAIRGQKHKILIDKELGDDDKLQTDQIKMQRLKQEYARFSEAADLPMQHERMEVAGFTWKDGKAAEQAAKTAERTAIKQPAFKQTVIVNTDNSKIQKAKNGKVSQKQNGIPTTTNTKSTYSVTWDENQGTSAWTTDRKKRLLSTEQSSVRSPVEIGTLYSADGKRIFRQKGDTGCVEFAPSQIRKMRGGVLTHNHPDKDYGCFSPADIEMLREAHLSEIRCVTPIGVFSMQRPQRWASSINNLDKIKEVYYDIDKTIGNDYFVRAFRGEISLLDANNLGQRAVVEEMCKRYKIPFRFESWDELSKR